MKIIQPSDYYARLPFLVGTRFLRAARRENSKLTTLGFRRAGFGVFQDLLGKVLWDHVLEARGDQDIWWIFKDHLLRAQEQPLPMSRKSGKRARRPAWMRKELLAKAKDKKEA